MCAHTAVHEKGWEHLGLGIHVCSIYNGKEEQFAPIVSFFNEGFGNNQKCMYVFDDGDPDHISRMIKGEASENKHLNILGYEGVYLKEGAFDPDKMITFLEQTVASSLEDGYDGVRAAGEMSWVHSSNTPVEKLIEYEQKLNSFYPSNKIAGVCQFDEQKFSHEFLIEMIRIHPYIVLDGILYENKYMYTDPQYEDSSREHFNGKDYETILSIIRD